MGHSAHPSRGDEGRGGRRRGRAVQRGASRWLQVYLPHQVPQDPALLEGPPRNDSSMPVTTADGKGEGKKKQRRNREVFIGEALGAGSLVEITFGSRWSLMKPCISRICVA
jgi:hypothetical protein